MSITQDAPNIAIVAGEALAAHRLIKADGTYADKSTTQDAVAATLEAVANGAVATCRQPHAGTMRVEVSEQVEQGDVAYKADDGKLSDTSTDSVRFGIFMEDGSAAGSVVEVMPD